MTLKDLLSQSTHYADKTRRDALTGIDELLTAHPSELGPNLAAVLEKVSERATDADKDVRKALLALWRDRLLPALEATNLRPFLPLVMAHFSKLVHLLPSVLNLYELSLPFSGCSTQL